MAQLFQKSEMRYLDPPTEEQWRAIRQRMNDKNWLFQSAWEYFGIAAKLPYAKAVISTDDLAEINGVLIFAQPPNVLISYVGFYVVDENCRGQGIGRKMWTIMEQHTDSSRTGVIHSYDDMTSKYRASGFPVPGETYKRIKGSMSQLKIALEEAIASMTNEKKLASQIRKIPSEVTIESIAEFDKTIMPFDRSAFLDAFFTFANGRAIVKSNGDGETVIAYGGTIPVFNEHDLRIGPIFATNFDDVILLLHALIADSSKTDYNLALCFDSESGQQLAGFLSCKEGVVVSEMKFSSSYSRPLEFKIDWSKVFVLSGHFTALLT